MNKGMMINVFYVCTVIKICMKISEKEQSMKIMCLSLDRQKFSYLSEN